MGAEADIAVLEIEEGQYGLADSGRARMSATQNVLSRYAAGHRSSGTNTG